MLRKYRFLISRRIVQIGLLVLFVGANIWGWKILMGNYSSAYVFESFYLSDPYAVIQSFATGFLISTDAVVGAIIVLLFYAIIGGRSFCSWVCPLNMVTDFASWVRGILGLNKEDDRVLINRNTRYWLLALGIILSAIMGIAAFEVVSPISMLYRGLIFGFGMGWAVVIMVFLFDLVVIDHGWCGHLCPLGAFYSVTSKYALIKVKHNVNNCTLCMKCKPVCHEKQVLKIIGKQSGFITSGECTNCGRCIEVCDDDALVFTLNKYK